MLSLADFVLPHRRRQREGRGSGSDAPPLVPVVKAARIDLVNDLVLTAEFEPFQQVDVMAKVSGYVRSINVDIGDRVREGQVLATLEIPEMEDDLTQSRRVHRSGASRDRHRLR